jgi:hypothetical protein
MTKLTQIAFAVSFVGLASAAYADAPKAPPAAPMAAPKVPQEVTDMIKNASGSWKCTGKSFNPDGTSMDMKATMTMKADLDNFWVHESFSAPMGKGSYKFEAYMTYDAGTSKWRRVQMDNWGGQDVGAAAMTGMKMDMDMDSNGPMGASKFRDHWDGSDMKAGAHSWGEASMDGGKTFVKVYDMVCKK